MSYINTVTGEIIDARSFQKRQARIAPARAARIYRPRQTWGQRKLNQLLPVIVAGIALAVCLMQVSK